MIIIFDLGKVILDFDQSKIVKRLVELSHHSETDVINAVYTSESARLFERGLISPEEFLASLHDRLQISLTLEEFEPIWNGIFTPMPGMIPLVAALKKLYRLGLLSNTNILNFEYIAATYSVLQGMDWHLSYRMHLVKPDPAIYLKVVEFYQTDPRAIFFIDDLTSNVAGARSIGMDAVHFESAEQVMNELARRGIVLEKNHG